MPINGYRGNSFITILINGTPYHKDFNPVPCAFHYRVFIPRCKYFPKPDLREKEDQSSLLSKIHFSPNPVKTEATLKWDLNYPVDNYQLFDLRGQLLLEKKLPPKISETTITMEHLPQGIYLLKLWSKNEFITYFKVIKN